MFSLSLRHLFHCALAALSIATATAAPVRLKLGTLAPKGTSYFNTLKTMGDQWRAASNGEVNLSIFAGGAQGGEADMVGMMKLDSMQAAMLTAVGLSEIELGVSGLQNIPMGFHSLEEVDYVTEKMRPILEERLAAKGFVVLFWTDGGWVRFFSNQPVTTPDDLRKLRLFSWSGFPEQVAIYKSAGFNAIPIETADIVPSLQTKLIDAVPLPPFFAMASQVDTRAPYMLDINWAPLVGALVVRKATWEKIPAETRAKLQEAAATAGREIKAASRREMIDSVIAMEKRGLKVTKLTPEQEKEWRAVCEATYPRVRGPVVPADIYDQTMKLLAEFRAANPVK
jgi:TRAP-type C4-dicarboxylate transport system substrate-binding protein